MRSGQTTRCTTSTTTLCGARSTATRYSNQSRNRWKQVSATCATGTATRYCRYTSRPTMYTCSSPLTRSTHRARLCERSRASRRGKCGNNTNRFWKTTCGAVGSVRNRTTLGRLVTFRQTRLSSISSARNTFSGAYGLHPRVKPRGTRPAPPVDLS